MTSIDCKWMNDHLEAYCCDQLPVREREMADQHVGNCAACRQELQALDDVDVLVKEVYRRRLAIAQAPRVSRKWAPAAAVASLAAATLAAFILFNPADEPLPTTSPAIVAEDSQDAVSKDNATAEIQRAKPDDISAPAPSVPSVPPSTNAAEAFAVIDPAGYVRRLEDYRGYVLLFGVWSPDQPQGARNLEQIYRTFSGDTRFRLLGVAARREGISDVIFPVVYNSDSRLLGAGESEFVLIDEAGVERARGSLLTDAAEAIRSVRTALEN